MRLLNTATLQLQDFVEGTQSPYVILSHTWGDQEVTFQDLHKYHEAIAQYPSAAQSSILASISSLEGFKKIVNCCAAAVKDGFDWIWVDTCCIDKTSSAELSEAINSMFRWYGQSAVCYAFLSDVSDTSDNFSGNDSSFRKSRWFTRGWTLQELLAPRHLRFYNQRWELIGQMMEESELCELVSSVTLIPPACLQNKDAIFKTCVAKRMSWASRRMTTRQEDLAYCLLGIFNINMPLLYGEGAQAFIRLQKEIINMTDDYSILAWGDLSSQVPTDDILWRTKFSGLDILALSPTMFKDCYDFEIIREAKPQNPKIQATKSGVQIELSIQRSVQNRLAVDAQLNCFSWRFPLSIISITLEKIEGVGPIMYMPDYIKQAVRRSSSLTPRIPNETKTVTRTVNLVSKAKASVKNWKDRRGQVVIVDVPDGYRAEIVHQEPEVVIQSKPNQLNNNCLQIILNSDYGKPKRHLSHIPPHLRPPFFLYSFWLHLWHWLSAWLRNNTYMQYRPKTYLGLKLTRVDPSVPSAEPTTFVLLLALEPLPSFLYHNSCIVPLPQDVQMVPTDVYCGSYWLNRFRKKLKTKNDAYIVNQNRFDTAIYFKITTQPKQPNWRLQSSIRATFFVLCTLASFLSRKLFHFSRLVFILSFHSFATVLIAWRATLNFNAVSGMLMIPLMSLMFAAHPCHLDFRRDHSDMRGDQFWISLIIFLYGAIAPITWIYVFGFDNSGFLAQ
ncbi:heterokaryon incompatibility protein-domain-containing protein [Xylaria cubensis]|nr:heterokaryon incompatibility protein-domain-containing protein [Xylaria cubensis]